MGAGLSAGMSRSPLSAADFVQYKLFAGVCITSEAGREAVHLRTYTRGEQRCGKGSDPAEGDRRLISPWELPEKAGGCLSNHPA